MLKPPTDLAVSTSAKKDDPMEEFDQYVLFKESEKLKEVRYRVLLSI